MARRSIDMLPLLDVFMVVLFVFATIQETQLDDSTQALDQSHEQLDEITRERDQQAERIEQLDQQVSQLERRSAELDELVAAYQQECGPRLPSGPVCPPASLNPDAHAQAQMAALHERLLDNMAVFEVDLEGVPNMATGELQNRCCYRADPPEGKWRSCGFMPSAEDDLIAWLEDGASGLIDGLSRTRGGNAIVLLRQDVNARVRSSNDLAELLRERMPSHRIYDDGIGAGESRCSD